jgi:hypothetical protein
MRERLVYSAEDVLSMLDDLLAGGDGSWWDGFYANRAKPVPFFAERPDENLVEWFAQDRLRPGRVLELGCCAIFDASVCDGCYDLVYDSGCFHHLPPHRRRDYVELVLRALKPAGSYGLVCFRPEGGSGLSDQEVYGRRGLGGGLGYSRERLLALWDGRLEILQLRQMVKTSERAKQFGEDFLWVLLARKEAGSSGSPHEGS